MNKEHTDHERRYARGMVAGLSRRDHDKAKAQADAEAVEFAEAALPAVVEVLEAEEKQESERWDLEDIWQEFEQELNALHFQEELPAHLIKASLQHAFDLGVRVGRERERNNDGP